MTHIKQCVRYVLSGLQETPYPVPYSEQASIIDAYMCRLYSESWMKTQSPKPYFIGPQSVALQLEHMVEPNEETKMSTQISIRKDYTVTEKADGIRALLYVSKTGRIYMINSNLKVLFTGAMTKEKNCWDSLLDGEFIMYGKGPNKKRLFLYAAFDIYYFGGMQKDAHVRPLPFSTTDETALEDKFRYSLLKKFHAMCKLQSVASNTTTGCEFHIRCKHFEHTIPDMQTIHQACASIWSKTYDYEIDGLIFTPMYSGVGGTKPNEANELNGRKFTWEASFKWKPPHYNTIDFLVEVQKDKDGQDLIRYIAHDIVYFKSGGFSGEGFLNGSQTKGNFVPEQHSDYIFATIGEEWGFIGTFTIILVYTLLIMRMINRANKHRNIFNKIFIYSVASIFFFQFSINVSMVIGIFPTVGIPLPFISYGGSSMVASILLFAGYVKFDYYKKEKW